MARFGEISPFGQTFKALLGNFVYDLFSIWQLWHFYDTEQIDIVENGQRLNIKTAIWSH